MPVPGDKVIDGNLKETREKARERRQGTAVSPAIKKLEQADKFFGDDDKSLDTKTELTDKQVYGIAALRSLDHVLKVKRTERKMITPEVYQDVEVLKGGLPGTMMLCNEIIKLNISLNRNSRKERVEILKEGSIYYNKDEMRIAMERAQSQKGITARLADFLFGRGN